MLLHKTNCFLIVIKPAVGGETRLSSRMTRVRTCKLTQLPTLNTQVPQSLLLSVHPANVPCIPINQLHHHQCPLFHDSSSSHSWLWLRGVCLAVCLCRGGMFGLRWACGKAPWGPGDQCGVIHQWPSRQDNGLSAGDIPGPRSPLNTSWAALSTTLTLLCVWGNYNEI